MIAFKGGFVGDNSNGGITVKIGCGSKRAVFDRFQQLGTDTGSYEFRCGSTFQFENFQRSRTGRPLPARQKNRRKSKSMPKRSNKIGNGSIITTTTTTNNSLTGVKRSREASAVAAESNNKRRRRTRKAVNSTSLYAVSSSSSVASDDNNSMSELSSLVSQRLLEFKSASSASSVASGASSVASGATTLSMSAGAPPLTRSVSDPTSFASVYVQPTGRHSSFHHQQQQQQLQHHQHVARRRNDTFFTEVDSDQDLDAAFGDDDGDDDSSMPILEAPPMLQRHNSLDLLAAVTKQTAAAL
jgi:hypothetical protein